MPKTVLFKDDEGGISIGRLIKFLTTPNGANVEVYQLDRYYHNLNDAIRGEVDEDWKEPEKKTS